MKRAKHSRRTPPISVTLTGVAVRREHVPVPPELGFISRMSAGEQNVAFGELVDTANVGMLTSAVAPGWTSTPLAAVPPPKPSLVAALCAWFRQLLPVRS